MEHRGAGSEFWGRAEASIVAKELVMLHAIVCPNVGHAIVHHFGAGAAVWGQSITPSVAHLLRERHELEIDYSRIRPGIVFEAVRGLVTSPSVSNASTIRLRAEAPAFRHAVGRPHTPIESMLHCDLGIDSALRLWGSVKADDQPQAAQQPGGANCDSATTLPIVFTVTFWEIRRSGDARIDRLMSEAAEKDRRIRELEAKVALAMCAQ
ncbi:hypothetical protein BJ928_12719 [Rhizobium sp. WW_1]|jgi:hypothetical protein|nr:hypothetical protein BJ928_12719 [Rhizobium sp. WW_1]